MGYGIKYLFVLWASQEKFWNITISLKPEYFEANYVKIKYQYIHGEEIFGPEKDMDMYAVSILVDLISSPKIVITCSQTIWILILIHLSQFELDQSHIKFQTVRSHVIIYFVETFG